MAPNAPNAVTDMSQAGLGRDLLLCVAAAVVVFLSGLGNGFTYDDKVIVEANPRIQSLDRIPEIWQTHWWLDPNVDESYGIHRGGDRLYRPLSMTSYSLNYAAHGLNPFGYKLVNLLLHALATVLVWQLTRVLIRDRWVALIAGLLFAVHPVHAEVVANSVGRAELLSAVFLLGGLLVLLPREGFPGWQRGLLAAGLCLLALFAKESAICSAPVVLTAILFRARSLGQWPSLKWWTPQFFFAALPALVYLPIRYIALDQSLIRAQPAGFLMNPLTEAALLGQIQGVFSIAGHYVRLLIVPIHLSSDYSFAVITPDPVITGMAVIGVAGALGLLLALTGWLRSQIVWQQVAALATMFLASYALVSNAFIHIGVTVAERLMYWPSVPALMLFAVLIVAGYRQLAAARDANPGLLRILRLGGIGLLIAFGLRTAVRAPEWASNELLFITDAETQPRSVKLAEMAAVTIYDQLASAVDEQEHQRLLDEATRLADRALELYPAHSSAMRVRGLMYLAAGDREKAIEYIDAAAAWQFNDPYLRALYAHVRDPEREQRLAELRAQVEAEPERADLLLIYGEELLAAKDPVPAFEVANRLIRLTPDDLDAHWLRARAALATLEGEEAIESLERVVALDPTRWEAHTNLSFALLGSDSDQALRHSETAMRLAPRQLEPHHNHAQLLLSLGRIDEAVQKLEAILASPDFPREHPLYSAIQNRLTEIKRHN